MEITVQSVKLLKEGKGSKGPWELWRVTTPDNTEFTTFDQKVKHLGTGAVIEISEPKTREGKLNFDKVVKVIKEGQTPRQTNGGDQDSPEKRASIEAQSAVDKVMNSYIQLLIAGIEAPEKLKKLWERSLDWCEAKIPTMEKKAKPLTPGPGAKTTAEEDWSNLRRPEETGKPAQFKDRGDFWKQATDHFGKPQSELVVILELNRVSDLTEDMFDEAWKKLEEAIFPKKK